MRTVTTIVARLAFVGLVGSCSSGKGGVCDDVVFTPGGPAPRACVHEVPNGATVAVDDAGTATVTVDGGVVATYPPCPCPRGDASMQLPRPDR
jgi:hypothetical protein